MQKLILAILIMSFFARLSAQSPEDNLLQNNVRNLIVKEWLVPDGLPSNAIRKIGKTSKGFLFIATYSGISLFDGKEFINFSSNNVPSIKSDNIYDFCKDKENNFWIATHRGIVVYNEKRFFIPPHLKELEKYSIQCLNFDERGTLWIGTISNGLFTYNKDGLKQVTEIEGINESIVSLLYTDDRGNMWIGTEKGELYRFDGKKYQKLLQTAVNNAIHTGILDKDDNLYFGTRNGLYIYKNDSVQLVSKGINFINNIKQDSKGRLWLSTNSGLYYFDKVAKKLHPAFDKEGFTNQIIQTTFFDNEGIIWIGTYRKGLIQLRAGAFQNFPFSSHGVDETPSAIAEINDSTLWIGTDEGKLFELQNGKYTEIPIKYPLNNSRIKRIYIDSKKNKWICSYNGLLKINNGTENFLNINSGFPDNIIRDIVETKNGNYWVGTRQSGLYLISENFQIIKSINTSSGLSSNFVMALKLEKSGKLYVATKNGLDIIENNKIINHYETKSGLVENLIFNIHEDENQVVWIATIEGLSRLEKDSIVNYTIKNGLINNKVFDVIEDNFGFLWLPTSNGIMRVNKAELNDYAKNKIKSIQTVLYDKSDGIYDQQYVSATKALKLNNGHIALNTISGISILDPNIADFKSSNQTLYIKSITTETGHYLNNLDEIALPSSTKYLQIDFSYIDFINPDKVEFYYTLEPFDIDWQAAGDERMAKYTNIPPGKYKFKLKAITKSKSENTLHSSVNFVIEPAFYETWWFKVLVIGALALIIWFIYVIRIKTIKYQRDLFEKEVEARTAEINKQKKAIEHNLEELEVQKDQIASKNEEILVARNKIEQAYINLKLLSDLGKKITSSLSEEEVIKTLYGNLKLLMDTDLVSVINYRRKKGKLTINSTIFKGKKVVPFETKFDPPKCILSHSIVKNAEIITNNFSKDYPSFSLSFSGIDSFKALTSVLIFPIRVKDQIVGLLTVQSFRKDSYSEYHYNLMHNLAVYVGIALENIKTYEKIQKQKDELQEANTAKDRMFSLIGHDLRGPVGTIKEFLDLILETPEMTDTESTVEILKTMQQSLGSAYSLLDNLLLWARNQRGQMEFIPENFYIKQPIDESISLVTESAKNKAIDIETQIDYNARVFADPNMITTILRNLISNAIKFTPKKGNILITTESHRVNENGKPIDQVEIKIIDSGIGISKENIQKILRVNELFSTPGTDKEQGSGLGISICIDFLKFHQQNLIVENNMEINNRPGTTFKFRLNSTQ